MFYVKIMLMDLASTLLSEKNKRKEIAVPVFQLVASELRHSYTPIS